MRSYLHTLLALTLAFCSLSSSSLRAAATRLACVGDSITDGYQMPDKAHNAYPAQLGRLLGEGWEVRNFGVSGACLTEEGGYPYFKREPALAALDWKPEVVVIALGTNDTKQENHGAHPDAYIPSYRNLIARFREANPAVRIYLCTPAPLFADVMGLKSEVLSKDILPAVHQIAEEVHAPLIDLFSALKDQEALFPDKVHPDPQGASLIAREVYGELMAREVPLATALDPQVNTAIIPVPALEQDCYHWWKRHADELALHSQEKPEVVLIGDSITHFWAGKPAFNRVNGPKAWETAFGSLSVVNLGFGWDRTQNVLWRLDHGELDGYEPKLVILNIGTNNLTPSQHARANTPEEITEGVLAICERVHAKHPQTEILVMGIFPRGHKAGDWLRGPISRTNQALSKALSLRDHLVFLDIGSRFLDSAGAMAPELMPDGTHPSELGYAIWVQALKESHLLPTH